MRYQKTHNKLRLYTRNLLATCLFATGFCGLYAQAQTAEQVFEDYFNNWFQVELIIFERIEDSSAGAESWPKNITLSYPDRQVFLRSAEALAEQERQTEELASEENSELLKKLRSTDGEDPLTKKIASSVEQSEIERLTPKEKPFVMLSPEIQLLRNEAQRLSRARSTRVLFHEAWRQPMDASKNAPGIVIKGGESFDKHYELEGSVTFYLSRYLHIIADLWFSEFEVNYGQETEHWPLLPTRPEFLISQLNQAAPTEDEENLDNTSWDISLSGQNTFSFDMDGGKTGFIDNDYSALTQQPFVVKNIATLQQRRRMRSTELHYIDHPRLGILVRIDKYRPEFTPPENDN